MASSVRNPLSKPAEETTNLLNPGDERAMESINKRVNMCYNLLHRSDDEDGDDNYSDADSDGTGDDNNFMSNRYEDRAGVLHYFDSQTDVDTQYDVPDNTGESVDFANSRYKNILKHVKELKNVKKATHEDMLVDDVRQHIADDISDTTYQKRMEEEIRAQRARQSLRSETAHNVKVRLNNDHRSDEQYTVVSDEDTYPSSKQKSSAFIRAMSNSRDITYSKVTNDMYQEMNKSSDSEEDGDDSRFSSFNGGIDGLENVLVNKRFCNDDTSYPICQVEGDSMSWSGGDITRNEGWVPKEAPSPLIPLAPVVQDKEHSDLTFSALNSSTAARKDSGRINTTSASLRDTNVFIEGDQSTASSPFSNITVKISNLQQRISNNTVLTASASKSLRMKEVRNSCNDAALSKQREKYDVNASIVMEKAPIQKNNSKIKAKITLPIIDSDSDLKQIYIRDDDSKNSTPEDLLMKKKKRREKKSKSLNKNVMKEYIIPGDDKTEDEPENSKKNLKKSLKKNKLKDSQNTITEDEFGDILSDISQEIKANNNKLDIVKKIANIKLNNKNSESRKDISKLEQNEKDSADQLKHKKAEEKIIKKLEEVLKKTNNDLKSREINKNTDVKNKETNKNENKEIIEKDVKYKESVKKDIKKKEQVKKDTKNAEVINKNIKDTVTMNQNNKNSTNNDMNIEESTCKDVQNKELVNKISKNKESQNKIINNKDVVAKDIMSKDVKNKDLIKKDIKTKEPTTKQIKVKESAKKDNKNKEVVKKDIKNKEIISKDIKSKDIGNKIIKNKDLKTKDTLSKEVNLKDIKNNDALNKVSTEVDNKSNLKIGSNISGDLTSKIETINSDILKKEIATSKLTETINTNDSIHQSTCKDDTDDSMIVDDSHMNIEEITRKFAAMEAAPEAKFEKVKKKKNVRKIIVQQTIPNSQPQQNSTNTKTHYNKFDKHNKYEYGNKNDYNKYNKENSKNANNKEMNPKYSSAHHNYDKSLSNTIQNKSIEPFTDSSFPALPHVNVNTSKPIVKFIENKTEIKVENNLTKSKNLIKKKNSFDKGNKNANKNASSTTNQKQPYHKSNNQQKDKQNYDHSDHKSKPRFDTSHSSTNAQPISAANKPNIKSQTPQVRVELNKNSPEKVMSSCIPEKVSSPPQKVSSPPQKLSSPPMKYRYNIKNDVNMIAGKFDLEASALFMYNEWMKISNPSNVKGTREVREVKRYECST